MCPQFFHSHICSLFVRIYRQTTSPFSIILHFLTSTWVFVLLQGIIWRHAGQVAILIVIYNPKLGQAKTTYLICIPTAAKELLARDCKRSSRTSKRNSIASAHSKTEHVSGRSGKSLFNLSYIDFFFKNYDSIYVLRVYSKLFLISHIHGGVILKRFSVKLTLIYA